MSFSIEDELALLESNMTKVTFQEAEPNFTAEEELPEIYKVETIIEKIKLENKFLIKILPKEAANAAEAANL